MITEFKVGHYYRYTKREFNTTAVYSYEMKMMLDGKIRKCIKVNSPTFCLFEGMEIHGCWAWYTGDLPYFEDVTSIENLSKLYKEIK